MVISSSWYVYATIFLVTLVQLPIAIDLLRFFFPHWKISRAAGKLVHVVLFVCMGLIFCIGISYHLFIYLPLTVPNPLRSLQGWLHLLFALWLWINMIGNYYHVVTIKPEKIERIKRSTSSEAKSSKEKRQPSVTSESSGTDDSQEPSSTDRKSSRPTNGLDWHPRDTHYCSVCESAISHIDHHCPFTGSCAGLHNYSHFFIGLVYGSVGLLYAVVMTLPYFFECNLKLVLWFFGLVQDKTVDAMCTDLEPHSQIFIPVFAGYVVTTLLLMMQILFLFADLSTYNVLTSWYKYPVGRFIWQRIRGKKYLDPDSRLNVLILKQRPSLWWYLVPVRNHRQADKHKAR